MNALLVYLLLLKATMFSFSGLASLPIIREDFVVRRHVLTDRQLNTALAIGHIGPGPIGLYVVSVGYFAGGAPGAIAGVAALITPAFLIIPMICFLGARADRPRVKSVIQALTLGGAGLIVSTAVPLARDAVTGIPLLTIAVGSFLLLSFTRIDTVWVILGSAATGVLIKLLG